ncbi:MAG: PIG-L family deacetylase [Candidatus Thorarchaeota archaeon]
MDLDIVAVGAHPDDAEIGTAGMLAKFIQEGYKVGIIDLTDGEPTPFTISTEERLEECRKASEIIGLTVRKTLDLPNRKLFDNFDNRIILAKQFRMLRPKLVLSPWGHTPNNASPDHYQAQLITEAATFYSKLSKWENYFENLPPHRINSTLYYSTMREIPVPFSSFIIDISETFSKKVEALSAYKSQFKANPKQPEGIIPWITAMGHYYGQMIEKKYGEILYSAKAIELENLSIFLK